MLHNPAIPEAPAQPALPRAMPVIVLLSVTLHAAVLLWLPRETARPVIGEPLMHLALLKSSSQAARKQASRPVPAVKAPARKQQPLTRHHSTPTPQIAPAARVFLQNRPTWQTSSNTRELNHPASAPTSNRTTKPDTRSAPASAARRLSLAERQDRARNSLAHIFMKRFYYPHLASQRGWQGAVLLKVMIAANGQLEKVTVSESSGYTILDRAALSTMQSIRMLPNSGTILQQQKLTLSFNVRYRLTDD